MANKILDAAARYVNACIDMNSESTNGTHDTSDYINDAANSFAESYDEYMTIFDALTRLFNE